MENFSDLITKRRSMRKFTEEELTQEEVVSLLKAALMSPTSKRTNCWQFIAVDDKETLAKLSICKESGSAFIKDAALAIVVLANPLVSDVWIEDASIASIMIQLQAEDLGLGVHHVAFAVEDGVANALADAEGKGIRLIDKAPRKGAENLNIAFLHPKSTMGVLTELCEK